MSEIDNTPRWNNFLLKAIRGTLEHRATWLCLLLREAEKKGIEWEEIGPPAIRACGHLHGGDLVRAGKSDRLTGLKKTLFTLPARLVFEMAIREASDDCLAIDFGHCPLVAAWQKLGCSDDEIGRLCDIAMEGDRGIAESYGSQLDLGDTIARGAPKCRIRFVKNG